MKTRSIFGAVVFVVLAGACSSASEAPPSTTPQRTCGLVVWHKPASAAARVEIVGDWDDWRRPGTTPVSREDGWRAAAIATKPGEHAYAIVEDGVWLTDDNEAMSGVHDGREVSVAIADDCDRPAIRVDGVDTTAAGEATVRATFVSARGGDPIERASIVARGRDGSALSVVSVDPATGTIVLAATALARGKYTYTLEARDGAGRVAEDARATAWIDGASAAEPWDPRDAIVYQVVIDRFRGKDGPLVQPAVPSARAGGSLAGVRQALESGEIEALGATALWLSPLYTNPEGEYPGADGRPYTSYHGYWPIDSRGIDGRVAAEDELDAFVAAAHAKGIRVLFDVVPNHVHAENPVTKAHPDWFKQDCVCGQGTCDWATHSQTCWFAPYLPDLDWTNAEAARSATDDVLWWFDRWDADGIRIDAVPMMPRGATRRISAFARRRYGHPGHALYIIGENFTGPTGYQSLRYDLGPFGLDGTFHFPLMWSLRDAIALERAPMSAVEATFRAGEEAWNGSGAVMGLMIGNHDVARFASVSAGNADGDTWTSPPQPIDPTVYAKQRVALAAVLTLPGAPVLYYGDEVGLAGRSDPDCRRVMPPDAKLIDAQVATRDLARKLGKARACARPLRRGDLVTLLADDERFVFERTLDGERAIVAISRRPTRAVDVRVSTPGQLVDVVTGVATDASAGTVHLDDAPFSVHVYLDAGSSCAAR